jgi:hypothetical protein
MAPGIPLQDLLWFLLGAFVLPAWLLAGAGDYLAHARSGIEQTSGVHEAALHLLQTAEIAVPTLAVLFLEVNATVLLACAGGVLAHCVTAWRDLRYTRPLREVTAGEQYLHAFLIVLPLVALALLVVLHWPDDTGPHWVLQRKREPFAPGTLAAVLAACAVFGVAPGLWEFIRCWRQARRDRR